MKRIVLIITQGFLPAKSFGGPVTSINNFASHFSDQYEIRIITGDHELNKKERLAGIDEGWNTVNSSWVYYVRNNNFTFKNLNYIIRPYKDRICAIYLSSIYLPNINFHAIRLGKKNNIKVILAPRGDLMKEAIAMKSKKKMLKKFVYFQFCRLFRVFNGISFQSTSDEETRGIKKYLGLYNNKIYQIPNMPVARNPKPCIEKEKNTLKVLFISRIMVKKNPLMAIKALGEVGAEYTVRFDIFGPLEDMDYWHKCELEINKVRESNKHLSINYGGSLSPEEANRIYHNYDCMIFPTFTENYGHVIAEAMLSDCPVIISRGTTPFDDCNGNGGYTASLDSTNEFCKALEIIARMDIYEYKKLIDKNNQYCDKKFKIGELKEKYINMIEE